MLLLLCVQNMVDILVGWHIDTAQEDSLLEFISSAQGRGHTPTTTSGPTGCRLY